MLYSDADILNAIESGALQIEPFRKEMVRPAGITLRLGHELLKPKPGIVVDVKEKVVPEFDEIRIAPDQPYTLEPNEFILGHTYELVTVGQNLGFFIEGRSTLARIGLTIVQTAMLVYPGHRNRCVTLELANHGPNPILLYPQMKIARVALFELKTPSQERYDDTGKYRTQTSVGRPIFKTEIVGD